MRWWVTGCARETVSTTAYRAGATGRRQKVIPPYHPHPRMYPPPPPISESHPQTPESHTHRVQPTCLHLIPAKKPAHARTSPTTHNLLNVSIERVVVPSNHHSVHRARHEADVAPTPYHDEHEACGSFSIVNSRLPKVGNSRSRYTRRSIHKRRKRQSLPASSTACGTIAGNVKCARQKTRLWVGGS
jgi:hypothetical protein